MKKIILILSCLTLASTSKAQLIPKHQMHVTNSTQSNLYLSSTIDNSGNVYAVGYADANSDIHPGTGVLNSGSASSYYITKYDPSTQNLLWSVTYTTTNFSTNSIKGIAINSLNEVFCIAYVTSSFDLDPTAGTAYVTNGTISQAVILKYSSTGTYLGYKQLNASSGYSRPNSIYIDSSDKIYIAGATSSTVNFDFGVTNYTLSTTAGSDFFMASYNSNLSFNWANLFGTLGNESETYINQIQTDALGNTYATCKSAGNGTFAGTALTNLNEFVVKRNSAGAISDCWKFDITAPYGNTNLRLNVFNNGKFYISGGYYGTVDFDPTAGVLSSTSYTLGSAADQFVGFYNNNGSPVWLYTFSNYINESFYATASDSQKNIFLWGNYDSATDYNLGTAIASFPNVNPNPQYMVVSYDSLGNYRGGRTFMTGIDPNYYSNMKLFPLANGIMFTGNSGGFGSTVDYAPGPPVMNIAVTGAANGIITTYDFCASAYQSTVSPNICAGASYTLPAGGVVSSAGTYTSSFFSYWGCDSLIYTNLTVNPLPGINATTSSSLLCVGQTATLMVSGATTYTWNTSAISNSISITPSVSTSYTITGTDANGCKNSVTITQSVSACTGILAQTNGESRSTNIFPNPTDGILTIELADVSEQIDIQVINALGEVVYQSKLTNKNTKLNAENLANGIYFLKIVSENKQEQIKFIKQ